MVRLVIFLCCLAASACASATGEGGLPVCDGKQRRTANPHGSVLALEGAAPATQAAEIQSDHQPCAGRR